MSWFFTQQRMVDMAILLFTAFAFVSAWVIGAWLQASPQLRQEFRAAFFDIFSWRSKRKTMADNTPELRWFTIYRAGSNAGVVLHRTKTATFKECVEEAIELGVDLDYADLSHQQLAGIKAARAQLNHADLTYSDIHNGDFSGAHLSRADLAHVYADSTSFVGAALHAATCEHGEFPYARFDGAICTETSFAQAEMSYAVLTDATFALADFTGACVALAKRQPNQLASAQLDHYREAVCTFLAAVPGCAAALLARMQAEERIWANDVGLSHTTPAFSMPCLSTVLPQLGLDVDWRTVPASRFRLAHNWFAQFDRDLFLARPSVWIPELIRAGEWRRTLTWLHAWQIVAPLETVPPPEQVRNVVHGRNLRIERKE